MRLQWTNFCNLCQFNYFCIISVNSYFSFTPFVSSFILKPLFQKWHFKIFTLKSPFQNHHFKFLRLHSGLIHFKITISNVTSPFPISWFQNIHLKIIIQTELYYYHPHLSHLALLSHCTTHCKHMAPLPLFQSLASFTLEFNRSTTSSSALK